MGGWRVEGAQCRCTRHISKIKENQEKEGGRGMDAEVITDGCCVTGCCGAAWPGSICRTSRAPSTLTPAKLASANRLSRWDPLFYSTIHFAGSFSFLSSCLLLLPPPPPPPPPLPLFRFVFFSASTSAFQRHQAGVALNYLDLRRYYRSRLSRFPSPPPSSSSSSSSSSPPPGHFYRGGRCCHL